MGDVLLLYVEPDAGLSLGSVRVAAQSNGCDVMVYHGLLMPVTESIAGGEPYPRVDTEWLMRCRRFFGDENV